MGKSLSLALLALVLLLGWAQYGVGQSEYGAVQLRFSGQLTTAGSCQQLANDVIRCQVPAGTQGSLLLTATVTPSANVVNITAVSLPVWASFQPVSGYGMASTTCSFVPPATSVGQTFQLLFRASTPAYGLYVDLTVILDVVAGGPPRTDENGRFSVPVSELPNTYVTGTLTECGQRPLPGVPVAVTLIPKPGISVVRSPGDISAVRVSVPEYGEVEIGDFSLLSSMDITGRTYTTIEVGQVCLRPAQPPPSEITPTAPISGTTDREGKFSVPLPWPGTSAAGRLTECGQRPLPNQPFELSLIPKGEVIASPNDIGGFVISSPGYEDVTITEFGRFSFLGLTSYLLGDVCLLPAAKPDLMFGERDFCIVVAPGDTPDEQVFTWERHFHEQDERLEPEKIQVPMRCKVGIRFWVENPGDVPITRPFSVRLAVVGSDGRELGHEDVTLQPSGSTLPQRWKVEKTLSVALGDGLPTFRLVIDPENAISEKDETNNTREHPCCPAYHQEGDPKIQAKDGVLKVKPDGSWVVGKDKPLTVEGEAVLGAPRPVAAATPSSNFLTEVPCPTLCPLELRYEWDFGDGTKATGKTVTHTYSKNGRYTITLTTVLGDERRTAIQEVEVTDRPLVSLSQQYKRVFVHRVSVTNAFTAVVEPNGNIIDRVDFTLNGQPVLSVPVGNNRFVCQLDMGALRPWPQRNTLVAVAVGRDQDGNPVSSDPASVEIPVAPVPSWLEWTLTLPPGPGQAPLSARPQDGSVLYSASFTFPYPPIDISYKIPEWVPLVDGEYKVKAKSDFSLLLSSLGTGQARLKGEAGFEKSSGDWTFGFSGEVEGRATLFNTPPITLTSGTFSLSLEGSVARSFNLSDLPTLSLPLKAATRIPLIGRGVKWLLNRAKLGLGLSLGLGGSVYFASADPGCCLEGIDCRGDVSLSGGLQVGLTLDLEVVSATAYGGGKFTATFTAPGEDLGFLDFDSLTLSGKVGISVSVDLWFAEVSKDFPLTFKCRILSPAQGFVTAPETEWTFLERPYATPTYSTFRGEAQTLEELGTVELWLVEEAFPHARPSLVRDPGLTMVAWTTDDLAKPFPLGREILCSFGPDLGSLGGPRALTDNLLPDSQVDLALDWTGNPVAVWVRHVSPPASPPRGEQDLTPELLSGLEITCARYDRLSGAWSEPLLLTDNAFPDHSPRFLLGPWGITGVIWTANAQGEIFPDASAPDTLYLARWDGQAFGEPELLREGDTALMRALADLGSRILYVWVEDMDGDWETPGDEELFWAAWDGVEWSKPERLTQNDLDDERPVLLPAGAGKALLLWVRIQPGEAGKEGVLLARSFGPDGWGPENVLLEGRHIFDFRAAQGPGGSVAVVWEEFSEQGPDLFASVYDPRSGSCTEPRQLTADPHLESQVDAVFDGRTLTLAFLRTTVEERTETVRYTGPDAGDPSVYYQDEEVEITAPMPGATHIYLLEVALP